MTHTLPPEDNHAFAQFVEEMAEIMMQGQEKGYSPQLNKLFGQLPNQQWWQGCEGSAKMVRGMQKLSAGKTEEAKQDFLKAACAAYTLVRDFT